MAEEPPPTSVHTPSDEEREFFYQVGAAITDWAQIDEILFNICAAVIKASKQHVAIIYDRTTTIGARLALVQELVNTALPEKDPPNGGHDHPATTEWKRLVKDITDELSVRNQLAHSPSSQLAETVERTDDDSLHIVDIWWASYVSNTEKLRGQSTKKRDLKIGDVKAHVQKIGQLWMRLRNFEKTTLPPLLPE